MNNNISSLLYKLYILCLPFGRLFDLPFGDLYNKVITQFSTLLMLIGVFVLLMSNVKIRNSRNYLFYNFYLYMLVASFVMSCVLIFIVDIHSENPFSAILGDIILYYFVVLSISYNGYCLTRLLPFNSLYTIFDWQVIILLIIGYAQLAGMLGFPGPYNLLSSVFALRELSWLSNLERGVTFFGTEPSSAAILTFIVIPYLFSSIRYNRGLKRFYYICASFLFSILVLGSNSSQMLIMFLTSLALFIWSSYRPISKFFFYGSFCIGLFFVLSYLSVDNLTLTNNRENSSLEYAVLGKVLDRENRSTAMRASTVINDMKVFFDYPLTGVGNGNQGFFYAQNQPTWTLISDEVNDLISSNTIPNGGGNIFPSLLSAYGIIGIFVFLFFLSRYKKLYCTSFLQCDKRINTIFRIAIVLLLFSGWHVVGIKQSETIIFILSLPCVASIKKNSI